MQEKKPLEILYYVNTVGKGKVHSFACLRRGVNTLFQEYLEKCLMAPVFQMSQERHAIEHSKSIFEELP